MPATLAQASLNATTDVDRMVIDEFRKSSVLLDALPFHNAVSPMGGGSTLTYGYHRVLAQRAAAFRAINAEYTPSEATKERFTTDLKVLGGSFQIDRVLADIARGAEVTFQMDQLIKATKAAFADEVINGDTAVDEDGFDGLDKALTGATTEMQADADWTDLDAAGASQGALDVFDTFLSLLDGAPSLVLGNELGLAKLRAIARRANMYTQSPVDGLRDTFGNPIERQRFGNVFIADPGDKPGSTQPIIPVYDPDNAVWTITNGATADGGTFTLGISVDGGPVEETAAIAWDATVGAAELVIEANDNVGAGNGTVSGAAGAWVITFSGALAGSDVTVTVVDQSVTDGGVAVVNTAVESANTGGLTDIYAVRIAMDAFHGVSAATGDLVKTWLPDFTRSGAVKTGEVEMGPVSVALKSTKAAAVLRGVRVR